MMSTKGVEYLQRAQECRDKALIVQSEVEKERWLRMAREWDELAEQYHPTASTDWIRNRASQMSDNPGHEDETGDEREENE